MRGLVAVLCAVAATAACGTPPELRPPAAPTTPGPSASSATPTPTPTLTLPVPTPTGAPTPSFAEGFAVDCAGHPTSAQVIRVLRRAPGLVPPGTRVTVQTGPLCAGSWQYTVVTVDRREPLAVVTEGRPGSLRLVTAGTDVCTIRVRVGAPPGIRAAAAC